MAMAAATITAASAGCGISASTGRSSSRAAARNAPATMLTSWLWLPSEAGTAVRLALEEIGKPWDSPAATLIAPSAANSWFASTR